jgi:hypothetical protein
MKLCWLIPSDRSGGISPVAISCCQQAAQNGHQTTLLLLGSPTWVTGDDFQVSSLGLKGWAPEVPTRLWQWLTENPQDILFFNGCGEMEAVIPHLPATTKAVFVVHDTIPGYWSKAVEEEDNLEAIVAVSETVARKFRHRLKQPEKLTVIHNGCAFPSLPERDNPRQNDLIFLGGDNPTKGAFDVLQVWKQLIKAGFTGRLHWFGNVAPKFRTKIAQLPNAERIHVYGFASRDVIFTTAASAKVLLMLSRVEPFGMATIEAMSVGCVPVAWDIDTGTQEIVSTDQTGLFAPLGNTKALTRSILHICENYEVFSQAVIERARGSFNETAMWQGYEMLLKHVLTLESIERSQTGQPLSPYQPPVHRFQKLPPRLRSFIRELIGSSPNLGYWLRDLRGW